MQSTDSHEEQHHGPHFSYGALIGVWLGLMILTGLTVAVAGINFQNLAVLVALIVASVKTYLVVSIFMHIKIENPVFKYFIAAAMFFLIVSLILLFSDYSFLHRT